MGVERITKGERTGMLKNNKYTKDINFHPKKSKNHHSCLYTEIR